MKPEIIIADYCEDCPYFDAESNSIYANNKAEVTVIQCIYRDQCRHTAEYVVKKCKEVEDDGK